MEKIFIGFIFKAIVWDDYQKKVAIALDFNSEVLAIKLRRDRLVDLEKLASFPLIS
jgi:hypothetical protein